MAQRREFHAGTFPVIEDSLGLIAAEAEDLLGRVDLVIEHLGTPLAHPVASSLRTLRVGPGQALRMLLATRPGRLVDAASRLRGLADSYHEDFVEPLNRTVAELGWAGVGHRAFIDYWATQMRHLASHDNAESMADRLRATADFVESVAGWFSQTRQALALALAEAFGSAEAIVLKGREELSGGGDALRRAVVTGRLRDSDRLVWAAAAIGHLTLQALLEWYEAGLRTFVADAVGTPVGDWPTRLAALSDDPATFQEQAGDYADSVWVRL